ncbi:MAG: hypothetical protein LC107_14325 [Chitinophagales bacterium]|nr:hypothetical protein [Chitinophagales bacterium]
MSEYFKNLNQEERELLKEAIPLIAVLISGADGDFSKSELDSAKKITHIRSYNLKSDIKAFYKDVDEDIVEKINHYIEILPNGVHQRNELISEKLAALNPILEKIDQPKRYNLYKGFLSFAEHIAKASGGVLGFFGIQSEEAKWITLPMIHPIPHYEDEEE